MEWATTTYHTGRIIINSDSRSAIATLKQFTVKNGMALKIKTAISESSLDIKFRWIRAHTGVMGNEKADLLAKEATCLSEINFDKIPISGVKNMIRNDTLMEWQERWTDSNKGRRTFWLLPSVEERIKDLRWLPVGHLTSQLYTGHCNCYKYLQRIGKRRTATCSCGEENQDLEHLLLKCGKYEKERIEISTLHRQCNGDSNLDMYLMIRDKKLLPDLLTFARRILM
ncbi:uncharacterized protein [Centruroides vittatus]|uniref:uncharacterized protein n=1 Tax=Centruroides vittatus TaxID=120091 RepID=UPI0035104533